MNVQHLGDDAELYALGALDPAERAVVEAHLATCGECAARVAAAEAVAASLASALPSYEPPARLESRIAAFGRRPWPTVTAWTRIAAVAAVVALAFFTWHEAVYRSERETASVALVTILHSHFDHVTMTKSEAAGPSAKVLYAKDGAWVYVVADGPAAGARVILRRAGSQEDAGALVAQGSVAVLLVQSASRPESVNLVLGGRIIDSATLRYASP